MKTHTLRGLRLGIVILILLSVCATTLFLGAGPSAASSGDVHVADFGAVPDDGNDDAVAIRDAITYAKANNRARLLFDAGQYDLKVPTGATHGTESEMTNSWYIYVSDMTDFTIEGAVDGNGVPTTMWMRLNPQVNGHELARTFLAENVTNLTMKNLLMDNDPYFYSAGTVVEKNGSVLTLEILDGHPRVDGMETWILGRYDMQNGVLLQAGASSGSSPPNPGDGYWHAGALVNVEGGNGRLQTLDNSTVASRTSVGEVLFWYFFNTNLPMVDAAHSTNWTLENIDIHGFTGFALRATFSDGVTARDVRVEPPPGRIMTGPRDGFKFMGSTGPVLMENNHWEGFQDDASNIHGGFLFVDSVQSTYVVKLQNIGDEPTVGTDVGFWTSDTFKEDFISTIQSYTTEGGSYVLTLSDPIPAWVGYGTIVSHYATTPTSIIVRNSTFKNTGGSGVMLRATNAQVYGNTFVNMSNPAVFLGAQPEDYHEGNFTYDVEVYDNTFDNVGWRASWFAGDPAAISVDVEKWSGPYMHDVNIHDNVFQNLPETSVWGVQQQAIYLRDVWNVWMKDNTFTNVFQDLTVDSGTTYNIYENLSPGDPTPTPSPTPIPVPGALNRVRFYPRTGFVSRMVGAKFQGSNVGRDSGYVDLYTINSIPAGDQWTEVTFYENPTAYRYVRYLSPDGSWGNVAEIEFYATDERLMGAGFGTPGSWSDRGNTFDKALDGDTATFFNAPESTGVYVGIDTGPTAP